MRHDIGPNNHKLHHLSFPGVVDVPLRRLTIPQTLWRQLAARLAGAGHCTGARHDFDDRVYAASSAIPRALRTTTTSRLLALGLVSRRGREDEGKHSLSTRTLKPFILVFCPSFKLSHPISRLPTRAIEPNSTLTVSRRGVCGLVPAPSSTPTLRRLGTGSLRVYALPPFSVPTYPYTHAQTLCVGLSSKTRGPSREVKPTWSAESKGPEHWSIPSNRHGARIQSANQFKTSLAVPADQPATTPFPQFKLKVEIDLSFGE
ncbi:hypothetical protein B0H16DRAFT_1468661 [Mycena metata]|uniref:Uncharacterized protein n=1 Tax=Mycena metata TaxID=1033252 RepID=A0AAD7MTH7_9AGAR|nr:hypothetical protein B0H16DRAFT_1468661 [Mycena metata]